MMTIIDCEKLNGDCGEIKIILDKDLEVWQYQQEIVRVCNQCENRVPCLSQTEDFCVLEKFNTN